VGQRRIRRRRAAARSWSYHDLGPGFLVGRSTTTATVAAAESVHSVYRILEIASRGVAADRKRANNNNRRHIIIAIAHLSSSRYYIIVMPKPRCRAVREELGDPAGTISDAAAAGVYFKT